jgi:hypothetical protein
MATNVTGLPGIQSTRTSTPRDIFIGGGGVQYASGKPIIINGTLSRDPDNTGNIDILRAGLMVSKIAATGLYATTCIGKTTAEYTAGTSLTVGAAVVTELVRRVGSSGTFYIMGSHVASTNEDDVIGAELITYSAASGTTITITAAQRNYPSGSLIIPIDMVQVVNYAAGIVQLNNTFILSEKYGIRVTDDSGTAINQFFKPLIGGQINTSYIINYPSVALDALWLKGELRDGKLGLTFSDTL